MEDGSSQPRTHIKTLPQNEQKERGLIALSLGKMHGKLINVWDREFHLTRTRPRLTLPGHAESREPQGQSNSEWLAAA